MTSTTPLPTGSPRSHLSSFPFFVSPSFPCTLQKKRRAGFRFIAFIPSLGPLCGAIFRRACRFNVEPIGGTKDDD